MAQIIKHRRGSITALKDVTANVGELVIATGSIGDFNAPVVFVGDTAIAGGYKPVSKIYHGNSAPTLGSSYGSTMDGVPYYSNNDKTLYILDHNGNIDLDLTGNIEGNTISGVTINNLQSTNITASFVSGAFIGDATGLYNIPASGVTGLNLSKIYSGSVQVSTDSVSGTITLSGGTVNVDNDVYINNYDTLYTNYIYANNNDYLEINANNYTYINSYNYTEIDYNEGDSGLYLSGDSGYGAELWSYVGDIFIHTINNSHNININSTNNVNVTGSNNIQVYTQNILDLRTNAGQVNINAGENTVYINTDAASGDVTMLTGNGNQLYISGNTHMQSSVYIDETLQMYHDGAFYIQDTNNTGIYVESANFTEIGQIDGTAYYYSQENYSEVYSSGNLEVIADGQLDLYSENGSPVYVSAYGGGMLYLSADGNEGNVQILNGSGNQLYISGNTHMQSTVYIDETLEMYHDGAFYIDDTASVGIQIQSANYTELTQKDYSAYIYTEQNYVELYSNGSLEVIAQGQLDLYSENGNPVYVSAYDGGTLYLNEDGGEGDIYIGNNSNNLYSNNVVVELSGTNYAELHSNDAWAWVESGQGAFLQANNGATGLSVRNGGEVEVTGSFYVTGSTYLSSTVYIDNSLEMYHDGQFYINDTNGSGISIETNNGYTQIGQTDGTGYFYSEYNYAEIYSAYETDVYAGGTIWIYTENNSGSINLSAIGDGTLYLNNYENSGDVYVLTGNGNKLYVQGDIIQTGSIYQSGSITTSGDITLRGNINVGNSLTGDTVNINAEISSSLIPSGSGIFDLGSMTNQWGELWVSGTAHIGTLDLGGIQLNNLDLPGDLVVSGTTTLSGSVLLPNLNTYKLTFTDGNGQLTTNNSNLETDGTYLYTYGYNGFGEIYLDTNDYAEMGWGDETNYIYMDSSGTYLYSYQGDTWIESFNNGDNVRVYSHSGNVYIDASNNLYLNNDTNASVNVDGTAYFTYDVYVRNNRTLYVSTIWDNTDGDNYLNLFGNPSDGGWWEGSNGADTTLANRVSNSNLSILNTNQGNINIVAENGSVNISSTNGTNITGSLVVSDGSGVFNSALITNNSNLTLTSGSNLSVENGGTATIDGYAYFHSSAYFTGNTYSDNYYGLTNNGNSLNLNGGVLGAPGVELMSTGQISLFAEGNSGGSNVINLTGSVFSNDNITINNANTLYTQYIYGIDSNSLNIGANNEVYIYSDASMYVELSTGNDEGGSNYSWVEAGGVGLQTYDSGSGLNHIVYLDNTGSLSLENVNLNITGSLNVANNVTFGGDLTVHDNLYVSGNFTVLGTGSIINLTGSQVDIGTNTIILNTYAPFERFGGISVYDSGSAAGTTGSLLWDSVNQDWVVSNPSGSSFTSAKLILGPENTGSLGNELGLTLGHIPVAQSSNNITDSPLTYLGTTLALNTNKFTVDSSSGDTVILGNFTIQGVGGSDAGSDTSYVVFRNSSNQLGFVNTTDTGNVMDQILGYDASTGMLEFSSVIDGGTY